MSSRVLNFSVYNPYVKSENGKHYTAQLITVSKVKFCLTKLMVGEARKSRVNLLLLPILKL